MSKNILNNNNINIFHKILGIIFITIGVFFYITPLPGTTFLIIVGFILLVGEKRTKYFLKEILGRKIFKFLQINKIVKKYENRRK